MHPKWNQDFQFSVSNRHWCWLGSVCIINVNRFLLQLGRWSLTFMIRILLWVLSTAHVHPPLLTCTPCSHEHTAHMHTHDVLVYLLLNFCLSYAQRERVIICWLFLFRFKMIFSEEFTFRLIWWMLIIETHSLWCVVATYMIVWVYRILTIDFVIVVGIVVWD